MTFLEDYPQMKIIRDDARRRRVAVHLVGGFLRDHLLQRPCLDFDFAVERGAVPFARAYARKIRGAFVLLDREHGCARVVKKHRGRTETYDFADFRGPTFRDDLKHRDFTVNTLSCDVNALSADTRIDDAIADVLKGIRDIRGRTIRMVSARAFIEDPLRLLRAFSLRALLDFRIEKKTRERIEKQKNLIRDVSCERVRDELFKILASPRTAANIRLMDRTGLLEKIVPEVSVMVGIAQGPYHHLDIWKHSLETVTQLEKLLASLRDNRELEAYLNEPLGGERKRVALLKLAALLHDVGKPVSKRKDREKMVFYGHERAGRNIVRNIALALKLSNNERRILQDMVLWHLRPGYLSNFAAPTRRALFRYFRDTKQETVSIALLSLADQKATRGPLTSQKDQEHHENICRGLIARYFERVREKPFVRLINGHDLIRTLKLKPSPLFARILGCVEERQATGKITTKAEALALARKLATDKN